MPSIGAKSFQTNTSSCTTELNKLKAMIFTIVLGFVMTIFVENIVWKQTIEIEMHSLMIKCFDEKPTINNKIIVFVIMKGIISR